MSDAINEHVQLFDAGELVTLYELDASALGGEVYHFTSMSYGNQPIVFGGVTYTPIDLETEGWEVSGKGTLPQPKIRLSNVNKVLAAAVIEFDDLLGAQLSRIRTFRKFLDDEPQADPGATFPLDIYRVERKAEHNKFFIEWELSAAIDQEGKQLPGRQFLKDSCTHVYRVYADGAFSYLRASCPYSGTTYFNQQGVSVTDPSLDKCGKRLSDCRLRFGQNGILPFRGFPGIGKHA